MDHEILPKKRKTAKTINIQSGTAFILHKGEQLRVHAPLGKQVSDMVLFNALDPREKISSGKTLDYEETLLIGKGNFLWSNRSQRMVHILEDTNGRNDFLLAPCSPETFKIMYGTKGYHPSCFENLHTHLAHYGILPDDIPTAFNIFMNVQFKPDGHIEVHPPFNSPTDYILFEARMDLVVGLTACSAEDSNGGSFRPIAYQIFS